MAIECNETVLRPPLAHQVSLARLRRELALNWKPGDRLPPLKVLSQSLGVGQVSLQRAARRLAGEGYLVSRTRHGTYVRKLPVIEPQDPQPHIRPSGLTRRVLLVHTATRDPFMQPAVDRLEAGLNHVGVSTEHHHAFQTASLDRPDWMEGFDGAVLIQPQVGFELRFPADRAVVVLCTAAYDPSSLVAEHDVVSVDSERGGALAAWHLRALGVESVAYIGCGRDGRWDATSAARRRGFVAAWGEVPDTQALLTPTYTAESGALAMSQWARMHDRPAGIFCASDDLALGFIYAALSHGLEAGRDYHIVGFDGQKRLRDLTAGRCATVASPVESMGRTAGELLLTRLADPRLPSRRVLLGCTMLRIAPAAAAAAY